MEALCLSFDEHFFEIEELSFLTLWWDFRKEASIWHRFRLLILTRLAGLFWSTYSSYRVLSLLGLVSPRFITSFPCQIRVSDVTFVTFFGDKQCYASHLSHFWEESRTQKYLFQLVMFFVTSFPRKGHIFAPPVQNFLNRKKCDDSAGTGTCFPLPVSDLSIISEAWSGKAIWAKTDPYSLINS